ncbi:MAG: hypothetical protein QG657_3794, partial [Acidobacteriota bacterium]|nr:hypothetical protein [Acidobacteriota bacterium]
MVNKPLPGQPGEPDNQLPADKEYSTTLPYEQLPGDGLNSFELLCFRVLMAEKKNPHFFARKGQDDYGVDIRVSEDNGETTVYQCKNLKGGKDKLNKSDFKKAFDKFNEKWVREQKLSVPNRFFYCTSARIAADNDSHSNFLTASEGFKKQFREEWGQSLQVEFWDCTDLDEKLKKYPDIVAELFGSEAAARHCRFYGWDSDLFINVLEDGGRDRFLQEYFKKKQRIYIPPDKREELDEKLKEHRKVLICGFPGTGKTSLALALAEGFSVCPSSEIIPPYVYYVNFKREINPDSFRKGIQQRGFLPTVFIFDDCQENIDLAIDLNYTLDHMAGEKQQVFCIFLLRTTLTREERRDEDAVLRELFNPNTVIDYTVDKRLFQEIAASLKPGLMGVDYNALFHLSGGDLFILDFILEKVDTAGDINAWKEEKGRCKLYQKAIDTYFKGERRSLGKILELLVLAQFDIGIHPEYYDRVNGAILQESMKKILDGLVVTAGTPARCYFLHSSLAELLCRAGGQEQRVGYIETVTRFAIEYLNHMVEVCVDSPEFNRFLTNLIFACLKLKEKPDEEKKIKIGFLQAPEVLSAVKDHFNRLTPILIVWMLRRLEGQEVYSDYFAVLKEKIESNQYLNTMINYGDNGASLLFRFLNEKDPGLFDQLKTKFDAAKLKILCEKGDFKLFMNYLKTALDKGGRKKSDKLWEQLEAKFINQIINGIIMEGHSIPNLYKWLRELQEKGVLEKWERKVSPAHYLKLIAANGTIFELIRFIQYSTDKRAGELIDSLSEDYLQDLIDKTIASGRSFRKLGLMDFKKKGVLVQWERKVRPAHYLKLIAANGTIFELINILHQSTKLMARNLMQCISREWSEGIIKNTIAKKLSLNTLPRRLKLLLCITDNDSRFFDEKIGIDNLFHLIINIGNPVILIRVLDILPESMQQSLIEAYQNL